MRGAGDPAVRSRYPCFHFDAYLFLSRRPHALSASCGVSPTANLRATVPRAILAFVATPAGPLCTFMATPEERCAPLFSVSRTGGRTPWKVRRSSLACPCPTKFLYLALQADFSAIQFHADQALIAQQLSETSTARGAARHPHPSSRQASSLVRVGP